MTSKWSLPFYISWYLLIQLVPGKEGGSIIVSGDAKISSLNSFNLLSENFPSSSNIIVDHQCPEIELITELMDWERGFFFVSNL